MRLLFGGHSFILSMLVKRKKMIHILTPVIHNYFRIKVHIQHEGLFQCQESAAGVQWSAGQKVSWPGVTPCPLHHSLETSAASRVLRGVEQDWL